MNEFEKNAQLKKRLEDLLKLAEEKRIQEENKSLEEKIKLLESQLGTVDNKTNVDRLLDELYGQRKIPIDLSAILNPRQIFEPQINFPIPLAVTEATKTFKEILPCLLEGSLSVNDPDIIQDFEIQSIAKRLNTKSIRLVLANSHGASRLQEIIVYKQLQEYLKSTEKKLQVNWLNKYSCDNKRYDFEFFNPSLKITPFTIDCKSITVVSNNLLVAKDKLQDPSRMADIYILHYLYLSDDSKTLHFKCRGWQDSQTLDWIIKHKEQLSNPSNELVFMFPEGLKIKPAILRDFIE